MAAHLRKQGVLSKIGERVRFARRRFGHDADASGDTQRGAASVCRRSAATDGCGDPYVTVNVLFISVGWMLQW